MIHILTSNDIQISSVHEYAENFILCHLYREYMLPLADPVMGYHFKIYHQDGTDLSEYKEYLDQPNFKYEFIPCSNLDQALESIAEDIADAEVDSELEAEEDDTRPDEISFVAITHDRNLNRLVCKHMDKILSSKECEVYTLDFYQYVKSVNIKKITDMIKNQLGIDMVYPDDPISFAYTIHLALYGVDR